MTRFKTFIIYLFVFFSGFGTLGTEIVGPRLFSSLFGYTTQIWAAIISVTLLGISVGYYLGGKIPRERIRLLLPLILTVNSFWLLGNSWLIWKVPAFLLRMGFVSVLLVASLAFIIPALLFSISSPLAITLLSENHSPEWITQLVGRVLAIGTVGSVLGALLAAFYFIPWLGLTASLRIFAIGNAFFAAYFLVGNHRLVALSVVAMCVVIPQPGFHWITDLTLLGQREGHYQTIRVYKDGEYTIQMHLGPTYESVMDLHTGEPASYVNKEIVAAAGDVAGKRVLIIGGAGHTMARSLEKRGAQITEVEIDPFVVEMSDAYFGPIRGEIVVEDGRTFVNNTNSRQFDFVILDAFNGVHYIPPQLTTYQFFLGVKRILRPGGLMLMNMIGVPTGPRSEAYRALTTTISAVFNHVRSSLDNTAFHNQEEFTQNIIIAASQEELTNLDYYPATTDGFLLTDDLNPIEIFLEQARGQDVPYRRALP